MNGQGQRLPDWAAADGVAGRQNGKKGQTPALDGVPCTPQWIVVVPLIGLVSLHLPPTIELLSHTHTVCDTLQQRDASSQSVKGVNGRHIDDSIIRKSVRLCRVLNELFGCRYANERFVFQSLTAVGERILETSGGSSWFSSALPLKFISNQGVVRNEWNFYRK